MKLGIVVGDAKDTIVQSQREPFSYYNKELKKYLNLEIKQYNANTFNNIDTICRNHDSDIIFLFPSWRESLREDLISRAENIVKNLKIDYPKRTIVFIDPFDQTSSNYFRLLPYVDYFLKRQCYKNLKEYKKNFVGGSLFTDYLATNYNLDFSQWHVGSELPTGSIHKIMPGWNLGTATRFKKSLFRKPLFGFNKEKKTIDIFCRISLGDTSKNEWYSKYRLMAIESVNSMISDYKVIVSAKDRNNLVSRRQYESEIKASRIVFSPFGWGEHCWRDCEAICADSLLIKPSMSHVATNPNIFLENETYVPIKWDFSDLKEKCCYYLEHPKQANIIIKNARETFEKYFQEKHFIMMIKRLIK